jgi:hypothetical protein
LQGAVYLCHLHEAFLVARFWFLDSGTQYGWWV